MDRPFAFCGPAACVLALTAALLSACGRGPAAPPADDVRSLDVFADGPRLHRLIGTAAPEAGSDRPRHLRLWHQTSDDAGVTWSGATEVAADHAVRPRATWRGEDAQIAARGDELLAVWSGRGEGVFGSGPAGSAVSRDGGRTWSAGPPPAGSGTTPDRGVRFPALHAGETGFDLVWIEARADARQIRHARAAAAGGVWSTPEILDDASCACCWNAVTTGPGGRTVAVYRDAEPRDMRARLRNPDGSWTAPAPVGDFGWDFNGCPHVGAGIAHDSAAGRLHAVVWTGKDGAAGVYAVRSEDGTDWGPPRRLGTADATHPDLVAAGGGRLVAAWTETDAEGDALHWAASEDGGTTWSAPQPIPGTAGRRPDHVRLAAGPGGVSAHWTESADAAASVVRTAKLP